MKRDKLYYSINFIVLLQTVILFVPMAFAVVRGADKQVWLCFMGLFCLAAAVHILKAFRLWFALYGHGIPFSEYMIQYCKAVPVSVVLPFKLGDLFRAYCFGHLIHNYLSGVLVVLLDRFCDTLALVVLLFILSAVSQVTLVNIFYVLLVFLLCVISCYWLFPAMYQYWKRYFLLAKASKRKIAALKLLQYMHTVYQELASVVKGRCLILIILSFLAWLLEIGGLVIIVNYLGEVFHISLISEYLTAVLTGGSLLYLQQFVVATVVMMFVAYVVLRCRKQIKKLVSK